MPSPWATSRPLRSSGAFFCTWSGDHRDLHSFPTRRSSDLEVEHVVQVHVGQERRHAAPLGRAFLTPCPHPVLQHADRKSTRLNSSHSQSSYAVFCLKKKSSQHANAAPDSRHRRRLPNRAPT